MNLLLSFIPLSGHIWTGCWALFRSYVNLLLSFIPLSGHIWTCCWALFRSYMNLLLSFIPLSGHIWTCCSVLFRSYMNLLLNFIPLSGHIWTCCWALFQYYQILDIPQHCQVIYEPVVELYSSIIRSYMNLFWRVFLYENFYNRFIYDLIALKQS